MSFKSYFCRSIRLQWYQRRFFSSSETEQNVTIANYVSNLSKILGCSAGTADLLLTRNKKILAFDLNNVQKIAVFCKSNFRLSEIIELPEVLSLSPYVLKDRTYALRELGCLTVTAGNILFFKHFMEQTPMELHNSGFHMNPEMYFARIVSQLKCPDDVQLQLTSKLLDLHSKNFTLLKMKALINATYLVWKFESSEKKVMSALHRCSSLCTKSLLSLESVYDLLLEKYQFSISKVYGSLNLLALDYDNLEELMMKVPVMCGVSIQHVASKQPSILKRPANALIDILHVLECHRISAVQLLSCPKILNFSASTVLSRLQHLKSAIDYETLRRDERFLWLVFHFSSVCENPKLVEDLKAVQFSNIPLNNKKLHLYSCECSNLRDVSFYLSIVFGNSIQDVKKELKQYPRIYIASLGNAQKIIEYLTAQGITKEQLWNCVGIVLYDAAVVIEYFKNLSHREDLQPPFVQWIGHHNVVQLLIYEIEKEQHFTGNGIYMKFAGYENESGQREEVVLDEEILALCSEDEGSEYVCNVNDL